MYVIFCCLICFMLQVFYTFLLRFFRRWRRTVWVLRRQKNWQKNGAARSDRKPTPIPQWTRRAVGSGGRSAVANLQRDRWQYHLFLCLVFTWRLLGRRCFFAARCNSSSAELTGFWRIFARHPCLAATRLPVLNFIQHKKLCHTWNCDCSNKIRKFKQTLSITLS